MGHKLWNRAANSSIWKICSKRPPTDVPGEFLSHSDRTTRRQLENWRLCEDSKSIFKMVSATAKADLRIKIAV
jgi:hypothetical protein